MLITTAAGSSEGKKKVVFCFKLVISFSYPVLYEQQKIEGTRQRRWEFLVFTVLRRHFLTHHTEVCVHIWGGGGISPS